MRLQTREVVGPSFRDNKVGLTTRGGGGGGGGSLMPKFCVGCTYLAG